MSSLLAPAPVRNIRVVRDPGDPPPIREETDSLAPERVHARLCTLAEANAGQSSPDPGRGITASAWLAGAYRIEYQRQYDELQATRAELARVRGVLSRVDDRYFPDELPDYSS